MSAWLTTLALSLFVAAEPTPAEPVPGKMPCAALGADDTVQVDLAEAPLLEVARLVSCALDKNLMFQPATLGERRVTFFGPKPLGRRELARLWYALLVDQGLVEERHGAFDLVRPAAR